MGDGVVQVAGQPFPLEQLDLVELARCGPAARYRNAAPRAQAREQDGQAADRVADGGRRRQGHREADLAPNMIAEPITISRPDPHRNSAYGRSST